MVWPGERRVGAVRGTPIVEQLLAVGLKGRDALGIIQEGVRSGLGESAISMSEVITVTETAATKITDLMLEEKKSEAGLRVFVQGGGCSGFQYGLMIEEGTGDPVADQVFESNGVRLYVDPISLRYLSGAQVDFVDNLTGGGFTIKNPNAKSTCGCGSSFDV
ncbi:MAG: iron-sulfur cluster insertion protein ErpA [Ilumatobacter sp.]|nr:iron-sulfur cluster insertion protein ErpA [Ilumatobacter sp.]